MADKDTGLEFPIGVYPDDKSVDKTIKHIVKKVDSSVKGGRIEVPVDITVPIDKTKTKLTKAQKDVVDELNKFASKGFSAVGKDIDDLASKFEKFSQALDQAGKGRQNKIFKEIRKQVEELQKSYKELQKTEKEARPYETKVKQTAKTKKKNAYNKYLDEQERYSKQAEGAGRRAKLKRELKEVRDNKSLVKSSGNIRASDTNEHSLRLSEISPYRSVGAYIQSKHKQEEDAKTKANLKTWTDKDYKEKAKGRRSRITTKKEYNADVAKQALEELRVTLGDIEKGVVDITEEMLVDQLGIIKTAFEKKGADLEETSIALKNALETRYSDTSMKRLGGTKGGEKGVGPGHELARETQKFIYDLWGKLIEATDPAITYAKRFAKDALEASETMRKMSKNEKHIASLYEQNKSVSRESAGYKELQNLSSIIKTGNDAIKNSINKQEAAVETQTNFDKIENSAERVADTAEGKKNQELISKAEEDLSSGFNTDATANKLIDVVEGEGMKPNQAFTELGENLKTIMCPCKEVLDSILAEIQLINKNGININDRAPGQRRTKANENTSLIPAGPNSLIPLDVWNIQRLQRLFEGKSETPDVNAGEVSESVVTTTRKNPNSIFTKLIDLFEKLTQTTANYRVIISKTSEEQDKLNAQRAEIFGLTRGKNPADSGDKINFARSMSLWRGRDKFRDLFKDIDLSKGIEIDTTAITDRLAKVLSGSEMFKAQTGGWLRNIVGATTGGLAFAFQPSLEKSRAQADAVNTIMANIRKAVNDVLQDIQDKESKLRGLKESGALKFDAEGKVDLEKSSNEAKTLVAQLEESKLVLTSLLADVGMVDQVVGRTHGRLGGIIKQLGFTSPILRDNNKILANVNAGLDKNGKALKFQTRLAELLNYSFQLIGRHIGQVFKNWMLQLNPINQIKKAFKEFEGYNVKWQRTMNVVKYNIHAILEPFMDKVAQFLVNGIGFIDIISMKVQKAFGQIPISLFDQAAADSQKIKEELEAATNVTAGFDELHDIGGDNTGANDLLGDIYKPQLSKEWEDLANRIGDLFAGIITGDMGFGEVMATILEILGKGLAVIGETIWNWLKNTTIGKYIIKHWKGILATILTIFLGWKLLKIAGSTLVSALFSNLGGLITKGFSVLWKSGGLIGMFKSGGISLGTVFGTALAAAAGVAIAVGGISYFGNKADKNSAYNIGLMGAGGKESDKKSNLGNGIGATLLGAGGLALAGLAIGGPLGAAIGAGIGAIAGILRTTLSPVLQQIEVDARDMNNELQKVKYYEGQVQGYTSQVNIFDEQLQLLKRSLDLSTQSVYEQGEKLGINKTRMDELVKSTQDGTFTTSMLIGKETELSGSLTDLAQKQAHTTETTKKLEEAQKKLLKAQTELSIAQDVEAGNFEIAAARIEVAEMQGVYSTEEATKKRIQLYKEASKEERDNLLQNLTKEQTTRMAEYMTTTKEGLGKLSKAWEESSDDTKKSILNSVGPETQNQLKQNLNSMDAIIGQHTSAWRKIGDTLTEMFSFLSGIKINTWTYNKEDKYYEDVAKKIKKDSNKKSDYNDEVLDELKRRGLIPKYALGTNYVPNDGLAYLHQGEAVIPKKYNQPYQQNDNSSLVNVINQLNQQVAAISSKVDQGIAVKGQFIQKGSDLVATVQKANNKLSNNILNNKVYAR